MKVNSNIEKLLHSAISLKNPHFLPNNFRKSTANLLFQHEFQQFFYSPNKASSRFIVVRDVLLLP